MAPSRVRQVEPVSRAMSQKVSVLNDSTRAMEPPFTSMR